MGTRAGYAGESLRATRRGRPRRAPRDRRARLGRPGRRGPRPRLPLLGWAPRMLGRVGRRCLLAIPPRFGVALIGFALMRAARGDAVTSLVGLQGNVSRERSAEPRRMFGLDRP